MSVPPVDCGSYDLAELRYQIIGSGAFMIIKRVVPTAEPRHTKDVILMCILLFRLAPILCVFLLTSEAFAGGDVFNGRIRQVEYLSPDHFSIELELISVPAGFDEKLVGQSIMVDLEYDPPWSNLWGDRKNGATRDQFRTGVTRLIAALSDQKIHQFGHMGDGLKANKGPNSFRATSLLLFSDGTVVFN